MKFRMRMTIDWNKREIEGEAGIRPLYKFTSFADFYRICRRCAYENYHTE